MIDKPLIFTKTLLIISLVGFVIIGVLLLTNHWGFAIRITSYIYLVLVIAIYAQK